MRDLATKVAYISTLSRKFCGINTEYMILSHAEGEHTPERIVEKIWLPDLRPTYRGGTLGVTMIGIHREDFLYLQIFYIDKNVMTQRQRSVCLDLGNTRNSTDTAKISNEAFETLRMYVDCTVFCTVNSVHKTHFEFSFEKSFFHFFRKRRTKNNNTTKYY